MQGFGPVVHLFVASHTFNNSARSQTSSSSALNSRDAAQGRKNGVTSKPSKALRAQHGTQRASKSVKSSAMHPRCRAEL